MEELISFAWPFLLSFGVFYGWRYSERALLRAGRTGLQKFVARDGVLVPKSAEDWRRPVSFWESARTQLRRDFISPLTWIMLGLAAFSIWTGAETSDLLSLAFGIGLLGLYLSMLHKTVRGRVEASAAGSFDAELVELPGPKFFSLGIATAKLADGRTFETSVPWRPTAALQARGHVTLVFAGNAAEPNKALFAGIRVPTSS